MSKPHISGECFSGIYPRLEEVYACTDPLQLSHWFRMLPPPTLDRKYEHRVFMLVWERFKMECNDEYMNIITTLKKMDREPQQGFSSNMEWR